MILTNLKHSYIINMEVQERSMFNRTKDRKCPIQLLISKIHSKYTVKDIKQDKLLT
mgnify:CR=1 FL=1